MKQSKNILSIAALAVVCTMAWSGISASFAAAPLTSVKAKTVVSKPTPKKATATPKATTTIVPTATPEPTPVPTPVDIRLFSFTTVGDSRTDDTVQVLSSQDKIWLNNTPVMQRMMDDAVSNHSNLFLFNGDMIMGYTPDSNTNILNRQYAYWRGLVAQLFEKGVYVIPVPGNHETQDKYKDANGKTVKKATVANENTWRDNMGDLILDMYRWFPVTGASYTTTNYSLTNSPQIGVDGITTDQSKLTYSFDFKDSHFAIISTDAVGNDIHAPSTWLEKDLATAKERGAKHMFVFAHRPVFTYKYTESVTPGGLDTNMTHANAVWDIIEKYHATYFCGHEHIYNVSQPRKNAYQVIVGSGGSPFEATTPTGKRTDQMYAWANVDVFESGKVKITIHGFDDKFGNIETIDTFNLTQ